MRVAQEISVEAYLILKDPRIRDSGSLYFATIEKIMARTFRKNVTFKGDDLHYVELSVPDGKGTFSYMRRFKGGMMMSPSSCGIFNDDRPLSSSARKEQRRHFKRSERQKWRSEIVYD